MHHFADKIVDYLKTNDNFGMRIEISHEDALLDTGGGLRKAAWFFKDSGSHSGDAAPFILHNVDVLTTIDLRPMLQFHAENHALATLAVQARKTSRYLLFDEELHLCGRRTGDGDPELIRPVSQSQALAFSGVHIISPRLLSLLNEDGAFSIITTYLRLAAHGEKILAFRADQYYWRDLGKPENIAAANADVKQNVIALAI